MILKKLLVQLDPVAFLQTYFHKLPYAQPGGCLAFTPLADWSVIDGMLAKEGADMIIGRLGTPYNGSKPKSALQVRTLLAEGLTVGLRKAERYDEGLRDLARAFEVDFAAPIDIHVYCTPSGQPGFGWHYDAEDLFIFQCSGSKEWSLRKNTVNPWPLMETLPVNMRFEREIMPVMRCRLEVGDWLYLPGGYWHRTEAGEESISLSIGVQSRTAMDVYDFLRSKLLASLEWRQRLPPLGAASVESNENLLRRYQDLFQTLGDHLAKSLADQSLAHDFIRMMRAQTSNDAVGRAEL
jgi:ribosomal protein L16 Arg81 hydroxylase